MVIQQPIRFPRCLLKYRHCSLQIVELPPFSRKDWLDYFRQWCELLKRRIENTNAFIGVDQMFPSLSLHKAETK
ncbi:MAG: hypothetical protein WKG06_18835 [Segetibacter sp.]